MLLVGSAGLMVHLLKPFVTPGTPGPPKPDAAGGTSWAEARRLTLHVASRPSAGGRIRRRDALQTACSTVATPPRMNATQNAICPRSEDATRSSDSARAVS